jgi:hypothetical protein
MRPWCTAFHQTASSRQPSKAEQRAAMGREAPAMAVALLAALVASAAMFMLAGTASASPAEGIQPLSKIAVHRATVEMQPSAYVRATPSLLGEQVLYAVPVRTHHARAALSISYSN